MANPERERKHVLLVEDQEDMWNVVAFILEDYKVTFARDFEEGLRLAKRRYFDIYILDHCLPDGSGVGLCRLIREFDPHTPILFYSAADYGLDKQEALRAGAKAVLAKSINFGELKHEVAQLTSVIDKRDVDARQAEITAIIEELASRQMKIAERIERAIMKYLRAEEKIIRLKAEKAFLAAGGTRGDFARQWPSVFREEMRGRRGSGDEKLKR